MDVIENQGKQIEYISIPPQDDVLGVITDIHDPRQWMNRVVRESVPITGHFVVKYMRGSIDHCLIDYTVQSTGDKIVNLPLSNFLYLIRRDELPDLNIPSNTMLDKTIKEAILYELDIIGLIYIKPSPWSPNSK